MTNQMMKLLDELTLAGACCGQQRCWQPAADVYCIPDGWLVKFDLAGIRASELQLHRAGNRLTVCGLRRDALVQQGVSSYSLEINYNRFERTIELPNNIEQAEIETEYRDGMLLIWLRQHS